MEETLRELCGEFGVSKERTNETIERALSFYPRAESHVGNITRLLQPYIDQKIRETSPRPELNAGHAWFGELQSQVMNNMSEAERKFIGLYLLALGEYLGARGVKQPAPRQPTSNADDRSPWVLVIVINAGRLEVIEALRSGDLTQIEDNALFQATQALWFDRAKAFRSSKLVGWFEPGRSSVSESEYDVHLIRMAIDTDVPGLHKNATYVDRLDAFRRVSGVGRVIEVSARLPSEAYGTTEVYSR